MKSFRPTIPRPSTMSPLLISSVQRCALGASHALFFVSVMAAQIVSPSSDAPKSEPAVVLPVFSVSDIVSASQKNRLATSTTRIATDLLDVPQSVSIVGPEMFADTFALRAVDAIKFVAGVSDSTLPGNVDRTQLRGIQSERAVRDGFEVAFLPGNLPLFNIDRIEIVKGPNPVISPSGPAGGTINRVSKRPAFQAASSVSLSLGEDENEFGVTADSTGAIHGRKDWAYRTVVGYKSGRGRYGARDRVTATGFYPALQYRDGRNSTVTFLGNFEKTEGIAYSGQYPLDPAIGDSGEKIRLYPGFNPDLDRYATGGKRASGHSYGLHAEYEITVSDHVSSILRGRLIETTYRNDGLRDIAPVGINYLVTGAYNPLTGRWTPGFTYGPGPDFSPIPVPVNINTVATGRVSNSVLNFDKNQYNLRDDWAARFGVPVDMFTSTTVAGVGLDYTRMFYLGQTVTVPGAFDVLAPANPVPLVYGAINDRRTATRLETSGYLSQSFGLLRSRLQLNAGITYYASDDSRTDNNAINASRTDWLSTRTVRHPTSIGVVIKPVANFSLFYGHNSNVVASDMRNIGFASPTQALSEGIQDELGLKTSLFGDRLFATVTHYKIRATNVAIPNPARIGNPDPTLPIFIFTDRVSKGWEIELSGQVTPDLSIRANYSYNEIKNAFGQPVRNAAKNMANAMARYRTPLKGWEVWSSLDYVGQRPGDTPQDGFAAASTRDRLIIYKPRFYIPARTLTNFGIAYTRDRWGFETYVSNLFDVDYVAGALTRSALYLGNPRQLNGRFTYRF